MRTDRTCRWGKGIVAVLAVAAAVLVAPVSVAAAAVPPGTVRVVAATATHETAAARRVVSAGAAKSSTTCGVPALAGGNTACVSVGARAGVEESSVRTRSRSSTWCDSLAAGQWWLNRTEACLHGLALTYSVRDAGGNSIATATFAIDEEVKLDPTLLSWNEDLTLTMTGGTGILAGLTVSVVADCNGPCEVENGHGSGPVSTGTVIEVGADVFAELGSDTKGAIRTDYTFSFYQPGVVPVAPGKTDGAPGVRCDIEVGTYGGCVNTLFTPTLALSLSDPAVGQAAAGYWWAQNKLADHWGTTAAPLHRQGSDAIAATNRATICNSTFVPNHTWNPPTDSCDEFPFARSLESGAQWGPGQLCAEVRVYKSGSSWYISPLNSPTGAERCMRAHIANASNAAAGSRLGIFTVNQRLLHGDGYKLSIVA
ncbi:hypothetical protein [Actinokineospora cianjurensis]|uniref:Uncharacterized protein n=1 Tax=Actinokineospora cianjurensis TaxID=585224 RepID=A0A421B2C8_9PSEU|nr:hypothetical protein [Actinokineospora cianjurensis]RLK58423.1 hypothetical protein CLV68_4525 [Actinokineospora cianjurensis]